MGQKNARLICQQNPWYQRWGPLSKINIPALLCQSPEPWHIKKITYAKANNMNGNIGIYFVPVRSKKETKETFTTPDQNSMWSVAHKDWQDGWEQLRNFQILKELESLTKCVNTPTTSVSSIRNTIKVHLLIFHIQLIKTQVFLFIYLLFICQLHIVHLLLLIWDRMN